VKLAFALAWAGSFLVLYPWKEIERELYQNVRRIDVVMGLIFVGLIAYFLVRTGNAGAAMESGLGTNLRDRMEDLFVARPRFKGIRDRLPPLDFRPSFAKRPFPSPLGGTRHDLGRSRWSTRFAFAFASYFCPLLGASTVFYWALWWVLAWLR